MCISLVAIALQKVICMMGPSLVPQTPLREEKGSGNIVYNELCQTQECGATNQIASFVISVTSHDFAHIIYRANLHCASDVYR